MRAELEVAGVPPARVEATDAPAQPPAKSRSTRRPDWFELLVLGVFAALSMWVVALDLWQVVVHGRTWTGTDGIYLVDQMQYLAWIRAASHHLLASNLFVLRPTAADYFQPAIAISGGLSALGVAPWLSLLLWKPVAVLAAFFGVRGYAHRSLTGTWERRVVLVLGLLFGSATIIYGSVGVIGDLFPAFLSWGYTFGLLALGLMLFALLAYDRGRSRGAGPRELITWAPALLGATASLLHPWQGELVILIVLGSEATLFWWNRHRLRPSLTVPLITVIGTGLPLVYYEVLGRTDLSWQLARVASKHSFSISTIVLGVAPLLLPALLVYRRRSTSFLPVATRVWPLMALVIYFLSASDVSATPLHAFEGITVPLAVLAVEGIRRLRFAGWPGRRAIAVAAVAAATIPAIIYQLNNAKSQVAPSPGNANFITVDEHQALRYLDRDRQPGGVLTRFYLGTIVPAETGRRTFTGDCLWSEPNCIPRAQIAQMVFDGSLPADAARYFVQQTGARFVLADCETRPDMASVLAPLTQSVQRFGCAAVYTLGRVSPPHGAFADVGSSSLPKSDTG